jgi:cytochrome c biogenesis factor
MAKNLYRDFGITLLIFWIFLFFICSFIFYIYINKITSQPTYFDTLIQNDILPYIFFKKNDPTMLYIFIILTLFNLIFSLVHGIYLFSKRKRSSYSQKSEKDILNTTFVGYLFIFTAHIILFLPIFLSMIKNNEIGNFNMNNNFILGFILLYGLLLIIGVILISIGLSEVKENDKKMKELKATSIVAPVSISITTILFSIIPLSCKLMSMNNSQNSLSKILQITSEKQQQSVNNSKNITTEFLQKII